MKTKTTVLALYSAVVSTICLTWIIFTQSGSNILRVRELSAARLTSEKIVVAIEGRELAAFGESTVTGGGMLALFDSKGEQALVASDGALSLRGGAPNLQDQLVTYLHGWALVLAASGDSSTLAMKGPKGYDLVLEAGRTLDDPLDIRGGRINLRNDQGSVKIDVTGVKPAAPRNW